jgi:hypothetical protein
VLFLRTMRPKCRPHAQPFRPIFRPSAANHHSNPAIGFSVVYGSRQ